MRVKKLTKADENTLYYVIYSPEVTFQHIPDMTIDDKNLIPFLKESCLPKETLFVNATKTLLSLHHTRQSQTSEWGKEYLPLPRQQPDYNLGLIKAYWRQHRRADLNPNPHPSISTEYTADGRIIHKIQSFHSIKN